MSSSLTSRLAIHVLFFFQDFGSDTLLITMIWGCCFFCAYDFVWSASFSFYLSWCRRWFIKHPVIIKRSLIVCECVCLCAGVSPGNYLMMWSLMTTQTNICPKVIYKMRGWPSVVPECVRMHACMITCVSLENIHLIPECAPWRYFAHFVLKIINQQKQFF